MKRLSMGELDSSRTRVAPIFTSLWALQGRRPSWLADLLELPEIDGEHPGAQLPPPGAVRRYGWGRAEEGCPGELALPAPPALLRWLVLHLDPSRIPTVRPAIDEPREALAAGDHNRCMEALRHLDEGTQPAEGAWHILEGPTFPDVYLETDDLVVVEGKRTERGPTRDTTFMPVRDQLLRHMDAALGYAGRSRRVVGFYAVEGDPPDDPAVPEKWRAAVRGTVSEDIVGESLPHRSSRDRAALAEGVLGAVTWKRICEIFGLSFPPLGVG
jgi:hypothetical protein